MRGACTEAESGRSGGIICRGTRPLYRQNKVVEHVYGICVVLNAVVVVGGVCRGQTHGPRRQRCRGRLALPADEGTAEHTAPPYRANAQPEHRNVEHHNGDDGGYEIVEQLHCLAHVGGDKIEKHVDRYHPAAEKIEQHYLERGKKHQRKQQPHRTSRAAAECHCQPQRRQRHDDIDRLCHRRHALREIQGYIRYGQHNESDGEKMFRNNTPGI